jgi:hypothetical protein
MRRKTWVSGLGAVVAIGAVLMLVTTFASAASSGLRTFAGTSSARPGFPRRP